MVGHYPTNNLIGRELLLRRPEPFTAIPRDNGRMRDYPQFPEVIPHLPAAASRRSGGRVSVPLWLVILSDQLPVIGLVGFYPTNYLIGREPLLRRPKAFIRQPGHTGSYAGVFG